MGRRGHGEGSIYQRKDGRWTAAITLEDHKRKTFYGRTRKEVQDKLKVALREQGLVFCNRNGEHVVEWWYSAHVFHKLLAEAGLPEIRFHDLRHSMATILLAANVNPKVVQERLGHSTIATTMDIYSHVLPSMQQDVARKIGEMFKDE